MSYPSSWKTYCDLLRNNAEFKPQDIGFKCDTDEVNRFSARYRMANSLESMTFKKFSQETSMGYSSLTKLLLVWSAFEIYLELVELKQKDIEDLLAKYQSHLVYLTIKNVKGYQKFFNFLQTKTNSTHKNHLENFENDSLTNASYLCSAIRHVYAHGYLTPNVEKLKPKTVSEICKILSNFLLDVLDKEFTNRINLYQESYNLKNTL